ncbi:uncharacterized protein LOC127007068 isoform X1 [Eriocheir sinensis]|uniref:uncharacterized protein LOC127007068 isoform X1 n=1 Tax=Eriocheir sinensis TaxID=95602 RepID=UPI0021C96BC6|nr:uncharacterized protein LOC127007068 isoform X1 [Eriocheir sinensis]
MEDAADTRRRISIIVAQTYQERRRHVVFSAATPKDSVVTFPSHVDHSFQHLRRLHHKGVQAVVEVVEGACQTEVRVPWSRWVETTPPTLPSQDEEAPQVTISPEVLARVEAAVQETAAVDVLSDDWGQLGLVDRSAALLLKPFNLPGKGSAPSRLAAAARKPPPTPPPPSAHTTALDGIACGGVVVYLCSCGYGGGGSGGSDVLFPPPPPPPPLAPSTLPPPPHFHHRYHIPSRNRTHTHTHTHTSFYDHYKLGCNSFASHLKIVTTPQPPPHTLLSPPPPYTHTPFSPSPSHTHTTITSSAPNALSLFISLPVGCFKFIHSQR